ncbi:MAG TPA: helix-turn-helix transcriptional regulator [Thermoanaerobaculia bacterium]|nr:helix-turn-helix transcriptional regulator [Thermoanaerobaculia bacterium]
MEGERGVDRLREEVKALLRRRGRSVRVLERELGLGNGTLSRVFRGRADLRFRHLELIARALGMTLQELLAEAYGLAVPDRRPRRHSRLRALVAEVVRAELADFWKSHGIRLEGDLARVVEAEPDQGG